MTTKIIALVDALGCLVRFVLLPGQRHDMMGVQPLIDDVHFDALIADKACSNRHRVEALASTRSRSTAVCSARPRRSSP